MAITRIQFKAYDSPLGNPHNFTGSCSAGNLLVAIITVGANTPPTGISDNLSNAWVGPINYQQTPNSGNIVKTQVWYCLSCNAGNPDITTTGGDDTNNLKLFIEYSGFTAAVLDVSAGTISPAGTTLAPTSNSFSIGGAASAVIAIYNEQTDGYAGTGAAGTNYSMMTENGGQVYIVEDWVNTTTATVAGFTLPDTATNHWTIYVVSFKNAAGGSGNPKVLFLH